MTIRYMTICYAGLLANFDDPSAAMIALAPEIAAYKAKDEKRRLQRDGNREPTGNPRGRPRLTEAEATESKARRRADQAAWLAAKRAKLRVDEKCGAPDTNTTWHATDLHRKGKEAHDS